MDTKASFDVNKTYKVMHAHATRYNVGDDAITIAAQRLIRDSLSPAYFEIIDVTRDEFIRSGEPITSFLPLYKLHKFNYSIKLIRAMMSADLVIIGGGELICGAFEFLGLASLAKIFGKPCYFIGIGVNMKGKSILQRAYTKYVLNNVDLFTVRDHEAKKELLDFGVDKKKIIFCYDMVFSLYNSKIYKTYDKKQKLGKKYRIGISLRAQETNKRKFGDEQVRRIALILNSIADRHDNNIDFIFYPFLDENSPYEKSLNSLETDLLISRKCIDYMSANRNCEIYSGDLHPESLMNSFLSLDLLFAMRLHANIICILTGTKVIPIGYSPKIERVFCSINSRIPVLSLQDCINVGKVVECIENVLVQDNPIDQATVVEISEVAKENIQALNLKNIKHKNRLYIFLKLPVAIIFLILHKTILLYSKW